MTLLSLPSGPQLIGQMSFTKTKAQASILTGVIGRWVTGLHTLHLIPSSMPGVTSSVSILTLLLIFWVGISLFSIYLDSHDKDYFEAKCLNGSIIIYSGLEYWASLVFYES